MTLAKKVELVMNQKTSAVRRPAKTWPKKDTVRVAICPVCGTSERSLLHTALTDTIFFCAPGKWDLYECSGCRSAYLDPQPSPESIGLAYGNYYTHAVQSGARGKGFSYWRSVAINGYQNRVWGGSVQPSSRSLGMLVSSVLPWERSWVDHLAMRDLPRPANGRSVLDIGCGNGGFLSNAMHAGWKTHGLDFDEDAVKAALELGIDEVTLGGIDALADQSDVYDAITASHVIEHVHDPVGMLKDCHRLLKPGGYFWIETPNITSLAHRRYGRHWRGLETPRHLVLFNWTALQGALESAGFRNVKTAPWRPMSLGLEITSRAIKADEDPNAARPQLKDRLISVMSDASSRLNREHREFITLVATK